jgi:sugar-specific transcriptional regulator TrmB
MNKLTPLLSQQKQLFENQRQALIYSSLLSSGPLGVEHIAKNTGLHREAIQRELKKMALLGTIVITKQGRNKKVRAVSTATLQDIVEKRFDEFNNILKPLLETEANSKKAQTSTFFGNRNYARLQVQLMRLQPKKTPITVLSVRPREWVEAMNEGKQLRKFEEYRIEKECDFLLLCFNELRGQVENNNREYFYWEPQNLKRKYKYISSEFSSPLQIQTWYDTCVISIFDAEPSTHIVIKDINVAKAMKAYFQLLWKTGK